MSTDERNRWWSALRQNGMLLSPAVLNEFLPDNPAGLPATRYEQLRNAATAFRTWEQTAREDDTTGLYRWLDVILETVLDYDPRRWQKHTSVFDRFKVSSNKRGGPGLAPERVLLGSDPLDPPKFLVKIDRTSKRVGFGRGRQVYSTFLELLRGTNVPLGILTNGHQFRLIYAGIDYDCWTEWEADRWFEDEAGIEELGGFITICGRFGTGEGKDFPLLSAVQESRTRQGELSQVLGEQTRRAVEILLKALNLSLKQHPDLATILTRNPGNDSEISEEDQNNALYQATIRLIMRMVVALFAEARGLLPKDSEIYYYSYSTEGLYTQLRQAAVSEGDATLDSQHQAWPRLLSLFRLVYEGSDLPDMAIPAYGGGLFRRGDAKSPDAVIRALSLFEHEKVQISDLVVYEILTLLKIGRVRARSGRTVRTVSGAVDFSDLRTEYIGMMYEGLLDYQLRKVKPEEEAVIFLNLGIQPVLPFSLLKSLPETQLKDLLQKLGKEKAEKKVEGEGEEGQEEEAAEPTEEPGDEISEDEAIPEELDEEAEIQGEDEKLKEILAWAVHAVEEANLVRRPRGRNPNLFQYEKEVERRAHSLIQPQSICYPGDLYLVRGTGTRKGTGTFYTKPQLAVPTVHRTLEPLLYQVEGEGEGRTLTPRAPEEILALKVCDPAMGSGSFLVAALRYITNALYESLWFHKRIRSRTTESSVITLPAGAISQGAATEEMLPCNIDDERFESLVKARLKRYVVERCIYGVDINPLAVELGKLSLWVETMDRELPFEFLDHKMKPGNSLVGCWFDRFQEYPVMAWLREGGDKGHKGLQFKEGTWTKAIKKVFDERVKSELKKVIEGQVTLDRTISDEVALKALFEKAVRRFESIHAMAITDYESREVFFRDCILNDEGLKQLKERFDLWCAIWFWPGEWMDDDAPTPDRFYHPTPELLTRMQILTDTLRFFHWELEFPDVFVAGKGGFDTVIGNPPWEISKPKSQEFFSLYDPIYRMRGKQDAIARQKELFTTNPEIERAWLSYVAAFKAMGNWNRNVAFPFGDPADETIGGNILSVIRGNANHELHEKWRKQRSRHQGFADTEHPFRYQGSADINTYKMFLEQAHALCRTGGRFGFIVPSGVYTDKGSTDLRTLFIKRCKWEWIWSFINWNKLFPSIYYRFKFAVSIAQKGTCSDVIKCGFNKKTFESWENPYQAYLLLNEKQIEIFSPDSKAILEISTSKDLNILYKIYQNPSRLGQLVDFTQQFDMTGDSKLFPPITSWVDNGYLQNQYGYYIFNKSIALPVYEGRMIGQFDAAEKKWISGRARTAVWEPTDPENKIPGPQYLIAKEDYDKSDKNLGGYALYYMKIASATNARSFIGTILCNEPSVYSLCQIINKNYSLLTWLKISVILNSLIYDYSIRQRLGGLNITGYVLKNTSIPKYPKYCEHFIEILSTALSFSHIRFACEWVIINEKYSNIISKKNWRSLWAITPHERIRLRCILDAIVTELYSLSFEDFSWILRDCGHPSEEMRYRYHSLDPKGFWRVDKEKDPELRHTVLALKAFADLKAIGLDAFCELNDGEGWMIPEMLTYKINPDGTVAFDTPDGKTVPVRERLGPRFRDWQLAGTPEESWRECEMHARNILGEEGLAKLIDEISSGNVYPQEEERIGITEKTLSVSGATMANSVAEVLKKAEEKEKELERTTKGQRTLGEW